MKTIGFARYTVLLTFLLGTAIFAFYYFTAVDEALFLGYFYIIAAGIFNLVVRVRLLINAAKDETGKRKYILTCLLMLANIPVAVMYILITLSLLNTIRITIVNQTGQPLSAVRISGCEEQVIAHMEVDESKTLYLDIPGDCAVLLEYQLGNKLIQEDMIGYVTHNMGVKLTYTIGKGQK
jgi:hypothetical protein